MTILAFLKDSYKMLSKDDSDDRQDPMICDVSA